MGPPAWPVRNSPGALLETRGRQCFCPLGGAERIGSEPVGGGDAGDGRGPTFISTGEKPPVEKNNIK